MVVPKGMYVKLPLTALALTQIQSPFPFSHVEDDISAQLSQLTVHSANVLFWASMIIQCLADMVCQLCWLWLIWFANV